MHGYAPEAAAALGLYDVTLGHLFPALIPVSILAYPAAHPKAKMRAHDSIALGDAGLLDERACLNREGHAYVRLPVGSWGAGYLGATGYLGAIGAMAKLLAHQRGGQPGPDNLERFFDDPDNRAAGLIARYAHQDCGILEQVGTFWNFGGAPCQLERSPPRLGQHEIEILAEIGFSPAQIAGFIADGMIIGS